jgi:hypothetical protein
MNGASGSMAARMDVDAARKHAGLKPLPIPDAKFSATETLQPKPAIVTEDATIGNEERLRGIPAVGRVSGTIKGTRPGDPSYQLEQAARDLHASLMRRARAQLRPTKP